MPKFSSASSPLRIVIQAVSLFFSGIFLAGMILGVKSAIHALCPYASICFGISKGVFFSAAAGAFWLTAAIGFGILVYTMFLGREFCGYICPLGTMQEAIFALRSRQYRNKHRIPYFLEKRFGRLKYAVLGVSAALSLWGIAFVYIRLCPIYALSQLPRLAIPGLLVFLLILVAGFFIERFWCRFLCPYAALLNLFQALGSLFGIKRKKIHRNLERCIDCGMCSLYCPMNINITETEYVQSAECIHCNVCAHKCPKPQTICCEKEN